MKDFYNKSSTLAEFVESHKKWLLDKYNGDIDEMEFIESIVCGGKKCIMAVHLPHYTV